MNNIEHTINFIKSKDETKLLINQVNDSIGLFYLNLISKEAESKKIKLNYKDVLSKEINKNLFEEEEIYICFSNNKKIIENYINADNKCVIFTDYKNFRIFSDKVLTINGYNYQKDIDYYLKEKHQIRDTEIIEYCTSSPYLTFSELSKYMVNRSNYIKENRIEEKNNFILEIRKNIFSLKKFNKSPQEIYNHLKLEVRYKKFNFLIY